MVAARKVFEKRGFFDARVADIVEAANVGYGSFYTHFSDKIDVLLELMGEYHDELNQNILTPAIMTKLDKYITTYTQVYRFQVLAYYDEGGPMVRIDAVVDTNNGNPRILYQRDITELGKGVDPRNIEQ